VIPFSDEIEERTKKVFQLLFKKLIKFGNGIKNGYQKRVFHDQLVPKVDYQETYKRLKDKYGHFTSLWTEETDPAKHVFEDVGIATFLICLWEKEQQQHPEKYKNRRQSFVDIGCGNGLLVHILTQEGYTGYGVDISRRKLWNVLGENVDLRGNFFIFIYFLLQHYTVW
jgi:SAM-dependent methyltransferase